jgi:hypothetical protein
MDAGYHRERTERLRRPEEYCPKHQVDLLQRQRSGTCTGGSGTSRIPNVPPAVV